MGMKSDSAGLGGGNRRDEEQPRSKAQGKYHRDANGPVSSTAMAKRGMPGDPYYKTQPCPYHRLGSCEMGEGCYFAHSPEELVPAPEAMMMNHFATMMGQQSTHSKKDKKEKK